METMNTAATLPQSQSVLNRIIGVFTSPRATMDDVVARPTWILPLLLIIVTVALTGYFLKDLIVDQALEGMARDGKMTQEQMNAAVPWIEMSAAIAPAIVTPIIYVILGKPYS